MPKEIGEEIEAINSEQTLDLLKFMFRDSLIDYMKKRKVYLTWMILSALSCIVMPLIFMKWKNNWTLIFPGLIGAGISYMMLTGLKISTRIKKIGVIGLPLTRIPFESGAAVIDRSGIWQSTNLKYPSLTEDTILELAKLKKEFEEFLRKYPVILSKDKKTISDNAEGFKDVLFKEEYDLVEYLSKMEELMGRLIMFQASLSLFRREHPVVKTFDLARQTFIPQAILETLTESELVQKAQQISGVIKATQGDMAGLILDADIIASELIKLIDHTLPRYKHSVNYSLSQVSIKFPTLITERLSDSAFNYYCTHCNADVNHYLQTAKYNRAGASKKVLYSRRTRMYMVDTEQRIWKCPVCESTTTTPIRQHKMNDELFTEVYDKLYEENRVERLRIYSGIDDQKRSFIEKAETQLHQVFRENRAKIDMVKSKMRSILAETEGDEAAIQSLQALLVNYQQMAQQKAAQIRDEIDRIKETIAADTAVAVNAASANIDAMIRDMDSKLDTYKDMDREADRKRDEWARRSAESSEAAARHLSWFRKRWTRS